MRLVAQLAAAIVLTAFVVSAAYYLILTIPLINLVGMLETKLAVSEHGQTPPDQKPRRGLFWRATTLGEPIPSDADGR